eukprot:14876886-Alexandrium_andersonii.AAC.1
MFSHCHTVLPISCSEAPLVADLPDCEVDDHVECSTSDSSDDANDTFASARQDWEEAAAEATRTSRQAGTPSTQPEAPQAATSSASSSDSAPYTVNMQGYVTQGVVRLGRVYSTGFGKRPSAH